MSRPQYTRATCGACGKKMVYVIGQYGDHPWIRCMACRLEKWFVRFPLDGYTTWPGSLEQAAVLLQVAQDPIVEDVGAI